MTPYAAEAFPHLFPDAQCFVIAIRPERTFWEKVTILHQEHFRSPERPLPLGYSRHYYDVALMAQSSIKQVAVDDLDLLAKVVAHKKQFYPRTWARYDLAVPGTLKVMPSRHWQRPLHNDYRNMADMFFKTPPLFDEILERLQGLETEINEPLP